MKKGYWISLYVKVENQDNLTIKEIEIEPAKYNMKLNRDKCNYIAMNSYIAMQNAMLDPPIQPTPHAI